MNIKSLVFVFFLCALIFISVVAIEQPGKQSGASEEPKTKLGVNKDGGLGEGEHGGDSEKGHTDDGLGFWINGGGWGGSIESGDFKGSVNIGGARGGGENNGLGGQGELGNEVGWRRGGGENGGFGGQGERGNEVSWRGENSVYGGQGGRRNEVSWRGGENRGFGGGREVESEGYAGLWDHKN